MGGEIEEKSREVTNLRSASKKNGGRTAEETDETEIEGGGFIKVTEKNMWLTRNGKSPKDTIQIRWEGV